MNVEIAVENLREVKDILDKNNVKFWLDSGTLLGAVRDGKIIEWDLDVDLGTWHNNKKKIISAFPQLKRRGFYASLVIYTSLGTKPRIIVAKKSGCDVYIGLYRKRGDYAYNIGIMRKGMERILSSYASILAERTYVRPEGTHIRKSERLSTPLPLRLRQLVANTMWSVLDRRALYVPVVIPKRYFEKLSTIQFYGMEFNVPSDVEDYLAYRYGDWRVPVRDWVFYRDDGAICRGEERCIHTSIYNFSKEKIDAGKR